MSEFINNTEIRKKKLAALAFAIMTGEADRKTVDEYWDLIRAVRPYDIFYIVDKLLLTSQDIRTVKKTVAKIINLFYEPLLEYAKQQQEKEPLFIRLLKEENREVEKILDRLKEQIKELSKKSKANEDTGKIKQDILKNILALKEYEKHYLKKENILFPYIEKQYEHHRCLSLMWSMHDDFRASLKSLEKLLTEKEMDLKKFHRETGELFFSVKPVIFREEYILYPVAIDMLSGDDWEEMLKEAVEIGFAYINPDISLAADRRKQAKEGAEESLPEGLVDLGTGQLSVEQIVLIFNHLPVDITFVDENDRVKYFSQPKHRFFTRSKAIIGRTVQNCHPHESVNVVEKILDSFRKGEKDEAAFWIQMKGRFILIKYFAVRDEKGDYKGTLEVSQDVTDIRHLEGERRLLDWD